MVFIFQGFKRGRVQLGIYGPLKVVPNQMLHFTDASRQSSQNNVILALGFLKLDELNLPVMNASGVVVRLAYPLVYLDLVLSFLLVFFINVVPVEGMLQNASVPCVETVSGLVHVAIS